MTEVKERYFAESFHQARQDMFDFFEELRKKHKQERIERI